LLTSRYFKEVLQFDQFELVFQTANNQYMWQARGGGDKIFMLQADMALVFDLEKHLNPSNGNMNCSLKVKRRGQTQCPPRRCGLAPNCIATITFSGSLILKPLFSKWSIPVAATESALLSRDMRDLRQWKQAYILYIAWFAVCVHRFFHRGFAVEPFILVHGSKMHK
jgi:hypothetical protein